jgi:hypothetical protein
MSPEFYSRAEGIYREQRDLYHYWRTCAYPKSVPASEAIDPVGIPRLLPRLSLVDAFENLDLLRYRLAGTQVRELFSIEIKGRLVFESGLQHKKMYWMEAFRKVVYHRLPMQGLVRGPLAGRDHLLLVWLRLPLQGSSGRIERILGYDAVLPLSSRETAEAFEHASLYGVRTASGW